MQRHELHSTSFHFRRVRFYAELEGGDCLDESVLCRILRNIRGGRHLVF